MDVSFIIVTYQRNNMLRRCVESIYAQKELPEAVELIVVDNDGGAELPEAPPHIEVRLERSGENLGAAGGRNLGMSLARGTHWLLLDDDAEFKGPLTARFMLDIFEQNPNCGALAGRGFSPDGQIQIEHLPFTDKVYATVIDSLAPAPYYYGFIHGLRAQAVQQVGNYPERYVIMAEEVDLAYRLIDAGYLILYHPDISVIHHHAQEGRVTLGQKYWYHNALNKIQLTWRLLPLPYPLTTMFVWSGAVLWYSKKPMLVWQIWWDLLRLIPLLSKERKPISQEALSYIRKSGGRLLY